MIDEDIKLRLLLGLPLEMKGIGSLHSPTVAQVVRLGLTRYYDYLSCLLIDRSYLDQELLPVRLSTFDVLVHFCYRDKDFRETLTGALSFLFREEAALLPAIAGGGFYLGDITERRTITESNFEQVQTVVRVANQVQKEAEGSDSYRPADDTARQMIDEMKKRQRKKRKPKADFSLHSIISGLVCKSNTITYSNVGDLTVYQLYDSFRRQDAIDSYHYTLQGIYAGNVDSKKISIDSLHWAKLIETI